MASAENSRGFREGHCPTHTMDHRRLDPARWCALQRSSMRCPRCHGAVAQTLQVFRCCGHHGKMLGDVQRQENRHAKTRLATFLCYVQICTFSCQDIPARFFLTGDKRGISTKVLGEDAWQTLRDDPSTSNKTCSSLKGKGDWFHFHEWQCRIVATSVASQTHVWPRVQKSAFDQLDATSKQLQIRRLFGIMYL